MLSFQASFLVHIEVIFISKCVQFSLFHILYVSTPYYLLFTFLAPNAQNLLQVPQKFLSVKEFCYQIKRGTAFWTAGIHLEERTVSQF